MVFFCASITIDTAVLTRTVRGEAVEVEKKGIGKSTGLEALLYLFVMDIDTVIPHRPNGILSPAPLRNCGETDRHRRHSFYDSYYGRAHSTLPLLH